MVHEESYKLLQVIENQQKRLKELSQVQQELGASEAEVTKQKKKAKVMANKIEDLTMEAQIFKEEIRDLGGNVQACLKKKGGDRMSVMKRPPQLNLDSTTSATSQMMDFGRLSNVMRMSAVERQKANLKGDYEEITEELERKYKQQLMQLAFSERLSEEEKKAIVMMNSAYESNKI